MVADVNEAMQDEKPSEAEKVSSSKDVYQAQKMLDDDDDEEKPL